MKKSHLLKIFYRLIFLMKLISPIKKRQLTVFDKNLTIFQNQKLRTFFLRTMIIFKINFLNYIMRAG